MPLPISGQLRSVARHYQALCAKQKGDFESARRLFERVAEEATPQYRVRALQAIGAAYYEQDELDAALPFYIAAGKAAIECDPITLAGSQKMIAVVRSIHGDHKQALDDLERLFPLVRAIGKHYPAFYYEYLNGLAVELGEVGRINEAQAVCQITLASPFAPVFPEFAETRNDLEAKRTSATPSIVAINAAPELALSPRPECEVKQVRSLAIRWLARAKFSFQRAPLPIAANAAIAVIGTIRSILDRVRYSINPRSPPSRFQV